MPTVAHTPPALPPETCRYNEWVARHGGASEALREACRLALQYAQQYNAYVELLAGQAALLAAWQAVLLVAFTRRRGGGPVAGLWQPAVVASVEWPMQQRRPLTGVLLRLPPPCHRHTCAPPPSLLSPQIRAAGGGCRGGLAR